MRTNNRTRTRLGWTFSYICSIFVHPDLNSARVGMRERSFATHTLLTSSFMGSCERLLLVYSQLSPSQLSPCKRPPPVRDCFVNNRFVSQSNTVSKTLVSDHCSNFLTDGDHFLGYKFDIFYCFMFLVNDHLR